MFSKIIVIKNNHNEIYDTHSIFIMKFDTHILMN